MNISYSLGEWHTYNINRCQCAVLGIPFLTNHLIKTYYQIPICIDNLVRTSAKTKPLFYIRNGQYT